MSTNSSDHSTAHFDDTAYPHKGPCDLCGFNTQVALGRYSLPWSHRAWLCALCDQVPIENIRKLYGDCWPVPSNVGIAVRGGCWVGNAVMAKLTPMIDSLRQEVDTLREEIKTLNQGPGNDLFDAK